VKKMIVIYHDVGGCHSSAIAANMHIKRLPMDMVPTEEELLSVPTFDNISKSDMGHMLFIGEDEFGAKVYTLGRRYNTKILIPAICDVYKNVNGSLEGLFLANTSPSVNNLMRIGGFSSRKLGLVNFGRPIVTKGTLKAYLQIAEIVREAKHQMQLVLK
jgi:hypothetical protein